MRSARARRVRWGLIVAVVALLAGYGGWRFYDYAYRHDRTRFNPASLQGEQPRYYYLDWRDRWSDDAILRAALSADGVVCSNRDRQVGGRIRHNPLRVIQASLALHDLLLDQPTPQRDAIFRRQLEWLTGEGAQRMSNGIPVWPHYDAFPRYGLTGPWVSALTQGQAVSLLVRAAAYTGDARYGEWADQAVRAFLEPGLPIVWRDGPEIFFEEYPSQPPSHVLNGCLFAWLGLWDYARYSGRTDVRELCARSIASIAARVPIYEWGDWTRYDVLQRRPTSPGYQEIHAALAETLHGILGDPFWGQRAARWRRAASDPGARSRVFFEVLFDKVRERVTPRRSAVRGLGLADGSAKSDPTDLRSLAVVGDRAAAE